MCKADYAGRVFFDPRDLLQVKYEMLRRVRVDGYTVSRSAASFGFSRPSFYQAQEAYAAGGLAALVPKKRGPRDAHKLSAPVVAVLQKTLAQQPQMKASDLAELVHQRFGISVHPRSVERALARQEKNASHEDHTAARACGSTRRRLRATATTLGRWPVDVRSARRGAGAPGGIGQLAGAMVEAAGSNRAVGCGHLARGSVAQAGLHRGRASAERHGAQPHERDIPY